MALPSSGIITAAMINAELGRASNAALSLNDAAVRALAGKPSGLISFADLRGKSSEIVVVVTADHVAGHNGVHTFFNTADWTSSTNKRLVINPGVRVRRLWLQANPWGGVLTIENNGILEGEGGAAGYGGLYAFYTDLGSPATLKVINNGTIRGGGGGGGQGGTGGAGTITSNGYVPSSGNYTYGGSGGPYWMVMNYSSNPADTSIAYNVSTSINGQNFSASSYVTSISSGGATHYRGNLQVSNPPAGEYYPWTHYFSVLYYGPVTTVIGGTLGGAGGVGQGSTGANTAGVAGTTPSGTAGRGGTGGTGGTWGKPGGTGAAGANGGSGSGTSGLAGGAAGASIQGYNRVTYTGSGTLIGPTSST